jgi:hypothetical protein
LGSKGAGLGFERGRAWSLSEDRGSHNQGLPCPACEPHPRPAASLQACLPSLRPPSHARPQVLQSLAFLHSLGLVHSDLKPENILIKSYSRWGGGAGAEERAPARCAVRPHRACLLSSLAHS